MQIRRVVTGHDEHGKAVFASDEQVDGYEPAMLDPLLLKPETSLAAFVGVSTSAFLGIVMLSAALIGWLRTEASAIERASLLVGAILLIFPGLLTDLAGLGLGAMVFALQTWRLRRLAPAVK